MQNQEEIWKDVVGYEGLYQVSNLGRVRSLGFDKWHKGKIIKGCFDGKKKYLFVSLHKEGKSKGFNIHRLVATAFIPNPNNLPQVNHKDEDKTNNCADNLEWCDAFYNMNYGTAMERMISTRRANNKNEDMVAKSKATKIKNNSYSAEKPVNQFTWQGEFVKRYISETEATRQTGITGISKCCHCKTKRAGDFIWVYDEDIDKINERILNSRPGTKKVYQYDIVGNLINVWNSGVEVCNTFGITKSTLCVHCKEKKTKPLKGFIWRYE